MKIIVVGRTTSEAISFAKEQIKYVPECYIKSILDVFHRYEVTFSDDSILICLSIFTARGHRADIAFVQNSPDVNVDLIITYNLTGSKLPFLDVQMFN